MASASLPSSGPPWKYDVFLSFRGEDTRNGFTSYLYDRLLNRGITTFMDVQDLVAGNDISPILLMAIEESRFAIVVLSENYASSTWCLEELTKILQCSDTNNTQVLPLFYHVDPSDVRDQRRSFKKAFTEYENSGRYEPEKVKQWREALNKVAHFFGWDSREYKSERELLEDVVKSVYSKLLPVEIKSTMTKFMAETSPPRWKYDVFLSFKGEDSWRGIVSELYHELPKEGIITFMDDQKLEVGAPISPTRLKAIEESRFAIIVLSPNYASSPWLLEELTKIVDCMEHNNRILPLFYNVQPSDVRHQKNSFAVAFAKHEAKSRHGIEKLNKWRYALNTVANFSGWDAQNYMSERELVQAVVKCVRYKLPSVEIESTMTEFMDEILGASTLIASASLPSAPPAWKYDVFLNYGGDDIRRGILSHLYYELQSRGIKIFSRDQDLEVGDAISTRLPTVIEQSRFAIVVLSENYASSTWCLEELTKILQCWETNKTQVLPLFYHVNPSDVRYQRSFKEAFTKYENSRRHEPDKVSQWRYALWKVANLTGWNSHNFKFERDLVEDIVEYMCSKIQPTEIEHEFFMKAESGLKDWRSRLHKGDGKEAIIQQSGRWQGKDYSCGGGNADDRSLYLCFAEYEGGKVSYVFLGLKLCDIVFTSSSASPSQKSQLRRLAEFSGNNLPFCMGCGVWRSKILLGGGTKPRYSHQPIPRQPVMGHFYHCPARQIYSFENPNPNVACIPFQKMLRGNVQPLLVELDDKLYALGKSVTGASFEVFDPNNNEWSSLPYPPVNCPSYPFSIGDSRAIFDQYFAIAGKNILVSDGITSHWFDTTDPKQGWRCLDRFSFMGSTVIVDDGEQFVLFLFKPSNSDAQHISVHLISYKFDYIKRDYGSVPLPTDFSKCRLDHLGDFPLTNYTLVHLGGNTVCLVVSEQKKTFRCVAFDFQVKVGDKAAPSLKINFLHIPMLVYEDIDMDVACSAAQDIDMDMACSAAQDIDMDMASGHMLGAFCCNLPIGLQ